MLIVSTNIIYSWETRSAPPRQKHQVNQETIKMQTLKDLKLMHNLDDMLR